MAAALLVVATGLSITLVAADVAIAPTPAEAALDVSCSSTQGIAYFVNTNSNSVSLVYTGTDQKVLDIPLGGSGSPYGLGATKDGRYLYVATGGASVKRIDLDTLAVTTITHGSFAATVGVWVSPDDSQVFVSNFGANTVSVISVATNQVTRVIDLGGTGGSAPGMMDAVGNQLFVGRDTQSTDNNRGTAVIDMASTTATTPTRWITNGTTAQYGGGQGGHTIAANSAYVATGTRDNGRSFATLQVYDTAAPSARARSIDLPAGTGDPHGMTFIKGTNYLVVGTNVGATEDGSARILVYNAATGALLRSIPTGQQQNSMVVQSPFGAKAYIAGYDSAATGVASRLTTAGDPSTWAFTEAPAGAALQTHPDNHTPGFSCLRPPTVAKSFAAPDLPLGGTTTLTITLSNSNVVPNTGVGLTDPLPSNIRIANPPAATNTCGGTVTASAGGGTLTLSGGTIPAATASGTSFPQTKSVGTCTITVSVVGVTAGTQTNTIAAGGVTSTLTGPNTVPATADITVTDRNFQCTTGLVYGVSAVSGVVSSINAATGATTTVGDMGSSSQGFNSLALPASGGRYIYALDRDTRQVVRFDVVTGTSTLLPGALQPALDDGVAIAGAINPVTGIYYMATTNGAANLGSNGVVDHPRNQWWLYAYDLNTGTPIGRVGTFAAPENGDFAFGPLGNLYVVAQTFTQPQTTQPGTLYRIDAPLPTTAGTTTLNPTILASGISFPDSINSMAFDSTGALAIGASTGDMGRYNPASGARLGAAATNTATPADFASCAPPNVISAVKNLPNGRQNPGDQFTLTINGFTGGNVGTTTGTDTGLQSTATETAGPVLGLDGTTYTVTESGAGTTTLTNYDRAWSCLNRADANAVLSSGTGSVATFTMPTTAIAADIRCTFTNNPPPVLRLQKALPDGRATNDTNDQFTLSISGTGVPAGTSATTTGTGSTATGTATFNNAARGTTYSIAETASGTTVLSRYSSTWSCVDTANGNAAVGSGGNGTTGTVTIPTGTTNIPNVLCTFSNRPTPAMTLTKTASSPSYVTGQTLTYTFVTTNTGNTNLTNVAISDPLPGLSALSCNRTAPVTLTPGATMTCTATKQMTQADVDAGSVLNTATVTGTPPSGPPLTRTASATVTAAPELNVAKSFTSASMNGSGVGTAVYSITVTGRYNATTYGALTDSPQFSPGITVTGVTWTVTASSGTAPAGGTINATQASYTLAPANTALAKNATHTYTLTVRFTYSGSVTAPVCAGPGSGLYNRVSLPAGQEPDTTDNAACGNLTRFELEKLDQSGSSRLDGSQWSIAPDNGGTPGTTLGAPAVSRTSAGLFSVVGLPAGRYWLTESLAPGGYNLLADPIQINVTSAGVVTLVLGNGGTDSGVSVSQPGGTGPYRISVRDVAAFDLPFTGGTGTRVWYVGGLLLILAAALAARARRRTGTRGGPWLA